MAAAGKPLTTTPIVAVDDPHAPVTVYDMVAEPTDTPDTTPDALTEAADDDELHAPPATELLSAVVAPAHTELLPVMVPADGAEPIVTVRVAVAVPQLPVTKYDIIAEPEATPVTSPAEVTEATDGADELHTPPLIVLLYVADVPGQSEVLPLSVPATGAEPTVIERVAVAEPQAPVTVYDIVAVPDATPLTTPDGVTEAIEGADELHDPPATEAVKAVKPPEHKVAAPDIEGVAVAPLMVTTRVATAAPQLPETVYDIVAVPAATPVTTPEGLMVAMAVLPELHEPPVTELTKVNDSPGQTRKPPDKVPALAPLLTVTARVAIADPQLLVTR